LGIEVQFSVHVLHYSVVVVATNVVVPGKSEFTVRLRRHREVLASTNLVEYREFVAAFLDSPVLLFRVSAKNDVLKTFYQFTACFTSSYSLYRQHLQKGNAKEPHSLHLTGEKPLRKMSSLVG
jgi:hypothetical protein